MSIHPASADMSCHMSTNKKHYWMLQDGIYCLHLYFYWFCISNSWNWEQIRGWYGRYCWI